MTVSPAELTPVDSLFELRSRVRRLLWLLALPVLALALSIAGCGEDNSETGSADLALVQSLQPDAGIPDEGVDLGVVSASTTTIVMLNNRGGRTASKISVDNLGNGFSFEGGRFPGRTGNCHSELQPRGACRMAVVFDPAEQSGSQSSQLVVRYFDGQNDKTVMRPISAVSGVQAFLGTTDCPTCNYNRSAFDFGGPFGIRQERTLYVKNFGGKPATSIAIGPLGNGFSFKGGTFPGFGGTCSSALASLAPGDSCSTVIAFEPGGRNGAVSSNLGFYYFDGRQGQVSNRSLAATATTQAFLVFRECATCSGSNLAMDFGSSGIPVDKTVYLANQGAQPARSMAAAGSLTNGFSFKGGTFPGSGGNCPVSGDLSPGNDCRVVLTFTPAGLDREQSSTLSVSYFDGAAVQVARRNVKATPLNRALVEVSTCPTCGALYGLELGVVGRPIDSSLYLFNRGAMAATNLSAAPLSAGFSFPGGSFPGPGGDCGTSLASGARCRLTLRFDPSGLSGVQSSTLRINYSDGTGSSSTSLSLRAEAAAQALLGFTTCSGCGRFQQFDYASWGVPIERTIYVENLGALPATDVVAQPLTNGFQFKGGSFPGTGGTCIGGRIDVGASCSIVIAFDPRGRDGQQTSAMSLNYFDGASGRVVTAQLVATAISNANLYVSFCPECTDYSGPLSFGRSGTPIVQNLYLTNSGARTGSSISVSIQAPFSFVGGSYPGTDGTCGTSLAAGASCSMRIRFDPAGREGLQVAVMRIDYSDASVPHTITKELWGTAISNAQLTVDSCIECLDQGRDFGRLGIPRDMLLEVHNHGAVTATGIVPSALASGFTYKGGAYPGVGGNCASSLAAAATCYVVVRFDPAVLSGLQVSTLTLNYFDGTTSGSASRLLTATATNRAVLNVDFYGSRFDCGSPLPYCYYHFGFFDVGSTAERVFEVFNNGGSAPTRIADDGALSLPFAYKGGAFPGTGGTCNSMPASGSSCTIVVTFSPTSAGERASLISLSYDDGLGTTQQAQRPVRGATR